MDLKTASEQSEHFLTFAAVYALIHKVIVKPLYLWFKGMKMLLDKFEEVVEKFDKMESEFQSLKEAMNKPKEP